MEKIDRFTERQPNGKYTHTFLSNFYPSPLQFGGLTYPTAEHLYQAAKITPSENPELAAKFAAAPTAAAVKKMGRSCKLRPDWEAVKIPAMRHVLSLKFAPKEELGRELQRTQNAWLEERNDWGDRVWGTVDGVGQNWLGHLLMARREELKFLDPCGYLGCDYGPSFSPCYTCQRCG